MSELPQPIAPIPLNDTPARLHEADLIHSLVGLTQGLYLAADLYRHYAAIATANGRQPAARNSYGKGLAARGYRSRHDTTGTRRCWIIE